MKYATLLCAMMGMVICRPDGFYRQEYQFKKSSSSFKNNELQTKDDDEGFYSKHGDLEGKSSPQINQNNEHSLFVNPSLGGGGHTVTTYGDRDLTQEAESVFARHNMGGLSSSGVDGTMAQNYGAQTRHNMGGMSSTGIDGTLGQSYAGQTRHNTGSAGVDGSVGQNYGGQRRAYSSYSSYSASGRTGDNQPTTNAQSNLQQLMQNVQNDLNQKVEDSVKQYQYRSSHSTISSNDIHSLEDELKAKLNKELDDALYKKYGNQGNRGSYSYTISSSGVYNPQANYDNKELTDLRNQLEQQLLKQLRDRVRTAQTETTSYSQTSRTYEGRSQVHHDSAEVEDLNRQPTRYSVHQTSTFPPLLHNNEDLQQNERVSYAGMVKGNSQRIPEDTQTAGTRTNSYNTKTSYRTTYQPSYSERVVVNPSIRVTDVAQDVQNKLSQQINDAVRMFEEKYTSSSYLLTNTRPNYQTALDDLKRNVRYNLTSNLKEELERNYGNQVQRGDYSFSSNSGNTANYRLQDLENLKKQVEENLIKHLENSFQQQEQRYVLSRSSIKTYNTYGRDFTQHGPMYTQPLTDSNGAHPTYVRVKVTPVVHPQSGYISAPMPTSSTHNQMELQQVTQQLQQDLTRQLHEAVERQRSTYTAASHTTQQNQAALEELNEELKQNLTRNLQQTLQQHYGDQGTRGGYTYTVSTSGVYNPKANYNSQDLDALMKQMQRDLEVQLREQMSKQQGTYKQTYYTSGTTSSGNYKPSRYTSHDDSGLYSTGMSNMQPVTLKKYNQFHTYHQGHTDVAGEDCMQGDMPSGFGYDQQYSDPYHFQTNRGYGNHHNHQSTDELGQEAEDLEDLTQQTEDELGQQVEDLDKLNQQTEDDFGNYYRNTGGYGRLQFGSQHTQQLGQQTEDLGQITEDLDGLTQRTENTSGKLWTKPDDGQQIEEFGQQAEDLDGLTQQTEDGFSKLEIGNQYRRTSKQLQTVQEIEDLGQQVEDLDQLTQQTEEGFSNLEVGSHSTPASQLNYGNQFQNHNGISSRPSLFKPTRHPKTVSLADIIGQQTEDKLEKLDINDYSSSKPKNDYDMSQEVKDFNHSTQQTEDSFSNYAIGNYHKPQTTHPIGQQLEDLDGLTQQTENTFGNFQIGSQQKPQSQPMGQQLEDLDGLTQQTEDSFGNFHVGNQHKPQNVFSQTENGFGKLEIGNQRAGHYRDVQQQVDLGQQLEDLDALTQKTEDSHGKIETGSHQHGIFGQQMEDSDGLTQQTEDGFSKGSQTEDDVYKLNVFNNRRQNTPGHISTVQTKPSMSVQNQQRQQTGSTSGNSEAFDQNSHSHQYPYVQETEDDVYKLNVFSNRRQNTLGHTSTVQTAPSMSVENHQQQHTGSTSGNSEAFNQNIRDESYVVEYQGHEHLNQQSQHSSQIHTINPSTTTNQNQSAHYEDEDLTQQISQDYFGNVKPVSQPGDDFIDHGDYLQHVGNRKHITHMENDDQIMQQEEDVFPQHKTEAISMADAHRMYISRPQYANSPRQMQFTRNEELATLAPGAYRSPYIFGHSEQQNTNNQFLRGSPYASANHQTMQEQMNINPQHNTVSLDVNRSPSVTGLNYSNQEQVADDFQQTVDADLQQSEEHAMEIPNIPASGYGRHAYSSINQHRTTSYNSGYNYGTHQMEEDLRLQEPGQHTGNEPSSSGHSGSLYSSRSSYTPMSYGRRLETPEPKVEEAVSDGGQGASPRVHATLEGKPLEDSELVTKITVTEGVPSELDTPEPKGFWQKVGGKISNSFTAAKQKAKDIADKINLG